MTKIKVEKSFLDQLIIAVLTDEQLINEYNALMDEYYDVENDKYEGLNQETAELIDLTLMELIARDLLDYVK